MADDAVSKDVLMYVADFLVDELSQNAAVASDTKQRMRSYIDNLSAFIAAKKPNGDANLAKGSKRKDAGRTDAELPEPKVPATTAKKPRQRSMHNVFLSYGAHCLPDRVREHKEKYLPQMTNMELMNRYSKSLPRQELQQFEDDYKHFLDEFNEQLADGKADMKVLAKRLHKYDLEQGIEMHPVFHGFMKFIEKEAGVPDQAEAKDADSGPAEDESSGGEQDKPVPAKTPPTKAAAKTGKTPTGRTSAKAPPKAAAPPKKAPATRAAPAAKGKAATKAAKKAPEPAPEVQAEESSEEESSSEEDEEAESE